MEQNCQVVTVPGKKDDPNYQVVRGHVPKELAKRFKLYCVENDVDNSQGLENILAEHLLSEEERNSITETSDLPPPETIAELVEQNYSQLLKLGGVEPERLEALKNGEKPTIRELVFLARDLDMDEELIVELRDRSFPKKNKRRASNGV